MAVERRVKPCTVWFTQTTRQGRVGLAKRSDTEGSSCNCANVAQMLTQNAQDSAAPRKRNTFWCSEQSPQEPSSFLFSTHLLLRFWMSLSLPSSILCFNKHASPVTWLQKQRILNRCQNLWPLQGGSEVASVCDLGHLHPHQTHALT